VGVKVEAKIKKDRQSIGFELSWVQSEPGDLTISDREPDAVAIRADTQPAPVAPAPAADAAIATESAQKKEKSAKKDEKQKTAKKERKLAEKADARKTESAKPRG
jgi:ribosomal protein L12E/L44/L45/RPP1/RPP2